MTDMDWIRVLSVASAVLGASSAIGLFVMTFMLDVFVKTDRGMCRLGDFVMWTMCLGLLCGAVALVMWIPR